MTNCFIKFHVNPAIPQETKTAIIAIKHGKLRIHISALMSAMPKTAYTAQRPFMSKTAWIALTSETASIVTVALIASIVTIQNISNTAKAAPNVTLLMTAWVAKMLCFQTESVTNNTSLKINN